MRKIEAIKEARIGALMQGGTWYVTRRGDNYKAMHESRYRGSADGRIAEMFDPAKVRRTVPPTATEEEIVLAKRNPSTGAARW